MNSKKHDKKPGRTKPLTAPVERTTGGLRCALFEEMEALRRGHSSAQRARSVAMMANSILQSVTVEIEYHKYVRSLPPTERDARKSVSLVGSAKGQRGGLALTT